MKVVGRSAWGLKPSCPGCAELRLLAVPARWVGAESEQCWGVGHHQASPLAEPTAWWGLSTKYVLRCFTLTFSMSEKNDYGYSLMFTLEMTAGIASVPLLMPAAPWSAGEDHVHILQSKEQCLIFVCLRGKVFQFSPVVMSCVYQLHFSNLQKGQ